MSSIAESAAPEVDRLVLTVNRARDVDHIARVATDAGLDDAGFLHYWWDFLLASTLTQVVADLRCRYHRPEEVARRIDALLDSRHLRLDGNRLIPTDRVLPVLETFRTETTDRARTAWAGHPEDVQVATAGADRMIDAMTDAHVVATVHASSPRPDDPFAGLYSRLLTVRYIRQHDHAAAWQAHDLAAHEMPPFTDLWQGLPVAPDTPGLDGLIERGLAQADGRGLTDAGRELREAIEQDTLQRSTRTYDALGEHAAAFLDALRRLPSGS